MKLPADERRFRQRMKIASGQENRKKDIRRNFPSVGRKWRRSETAMAREAGNYCKKGRVFSNAGLVFGLLLEINGCEAVSRRDTISACRFPIQHSTKIKNEHEKSPHHLRADHSFGGSHRQLRQTKSRASVAGRPLVRL
jgi:hypothetical protein